MSARRPLKAYSIFSAAGKYLFMEIAPNIAEAKESASRRCISLIRVNSSYVFQCGSPTDIVAKPAKEGDHDQVA